jgi:hypothetical protein
VSNLFFYVAAMLLRACFCVFRSGLPSGFEPTPVSTPPVYSKTYLSELQAATPTTPSTTGARTGEQYDELTRAKFGNIDEGELHSLFF